MAQSSKVLQQCKISYHVCAFQFKNFKNFPFYLNVDLLEINLSRQVNFQILLLQEADEEESEGDEEVKNR